MKKTTLALSFFASVSLSPCSDFGIALDYSVQNGRQTSDPPGPGLSLRYKHGLFHLGGYEVHDYNLANPFEFDGDIVQILVGWQQNLGYGLRSQSWIGTWNSDGNELHSIKPEAPAEMVPIKAVGPGVRQEVLWQPGNTRLSLILGAEIFRDHNKLWKPKSRVGLSVDFLGPQEGGMQWPTISYDSTRFWEASLGLGLPFIFQGSILHTLGQNGFVEAGLNFSPFFGEAILWGGWQSDIKNQVLWRWGAGFVSAGFVDESVYGVHLGGERVRYWSSHWGWKTSLGLSTVYHKDDGFNGIVPIPKLGLSLVGKY